MPRKRYPSLGAFESKLLREALISAVMKLGSAPAGWESGYADGGNRRHPDHY